MFSEATYICAHPEKHTGNSKAGTEQNNTINGMKQFNQDDFFRFFRGEFTDNEVNELNSWLEASEQNKALYRKAHEMFDALLICSMEDAEKAAETKKKRSRVFRIAAAVIANAAAVACIFFLAHNIEANKMDSKLANSLTTIEVPAGQRIDLTLEDGTKVKMNSGAVLSYPAMFSKDSREVNLRGEAFFEVSHNSRRPFTVHTFASDIRVLGTKFNVNADEEMNQFTTILLDGSVKVTSAADNNEYIIMRPSDVVSMVNGHLIYKGRYSHSDVSWTEGIVVLDGLSFDKLIRKLENAYGVDIVIDRENIPAMDGITGEIRISDGIDHAMKVLQHIVPFNYSRDPLTGKIHIR